MSRVGLDFRGYSPAPTCSGWTCPQCGRHWISAVSPPTKCSDCGKTRGVLSLAEKLERIRLRKLKKKARLRAEAKRNLRPVAEQKVSPL